MISAKKMGMQINNQNSILRDTIRENLKNYMKRFKIQKSGRNRDNIRKMIYLYNVQWDIKQPCWKINKSLIDSLIPGNSYDDKKES